MKFLVQKKKSAIPEALLYLFIGALAQTLISAYSEKLASIDKGIAEWARNQTIDLDYEMNTGLVRFLNELTVMVFVIDAVLIIAMICYDVFALKLSLKENLWAYLFIVVAPLIYLLLSYLTLLGAKNLIGRPRPYQTLQFYPPFDKEPQCKVEFQPAYRRYTGPNPCSYELVSCPSGHSMTVVCSSLLLCFVVNFNARFTRAKICKTKQKTLRWNAMAHVALQYFAYAILAVFPATVMVGRISVLMHFFTDVCGGAALGVTFAFVFRLLEPHLEHVETEGQCQEKALLL